MMFQIKLVFKVSQGLYFKREIKCTSCVFPGQSISSDRLYFFTPDGR